MHPETIYIQPAVGLNLIADKNELAQVKTGLIAAYYDRGKQKILYEIVDDTKDINTFNDNVLKNKDHLMALAKGT